MEKLNNKVNKRASGRVWKRERVGLREKAR